MKRLLTAHERGASVKSCWVTMLASGGWNSQRLRPFTAAHQADGCSSGLTPVPLGKPVK